MKILTVTLFVGCAASAAAFSACDGDGDTAAANDAGGASAESSSTSGGSSSGEAGAAASGCAAIADAQCRRYERCSPLLAHGLIGDLAECKERMAIVCERTTKAPGASPYSAACLAALEGSCDTYDEPACASTGALADGAPCEFGRQCAAGHCAGVGGSDYCGTCKPAGSTWDPADASCENDDCDRGLSCIGFSWSVSGGNTLGKCETTRTLGQACTDSEDCNPGGRCRGDSCPLTYGFACLDGGCSLPLGEGAKCPQAFNAGPSCDVRKELFCQLGAAGGGASCAKIIFGGESEPCRNTEGPAPGSCIGSTRCVGDAGAQKCVRKATEGAACAQDRDCRFGAACLGGVCTIAPPDRCK